jgi:beta-lactamase superfamily II metal-dependent hydrolase
MVATVRMYNVGFGDAFLITVPRRGRPWRMLVDCGVHMHGAGEHHLDRIVDDIIETVAADSDDRPRIDVVVATHRHRDHIAGFDNERWHDVEVGEVWLPWVEDPDDADAVALRNRQQAAAFNLHLHFSAAGLEQHLSEFVLNSLSNDDAMWVLQNGFAGRPRRRYISAQGAKAHPLPGVRGGCVFFLGPPRDPRYLAAMDPPKAQRWLRAGPASTPPAASASPAAADPSADLFPGFVVPAADYAARYPHLALEPGLVRSFGTTPVDTLMAASLLDRAVNNTSVMFLLQVGDALLLFPGDAQWGAWQPLLDDPDVRSLLTRTTLYKISHHGSHNGTPVEVAREVLTGITSMLSVRPVERWVNIPKAELVASLENAPGRIVSSLDDAIGEGVTRHPEGLWKEVSIAT